MTGRATFAELPEAAATGTAATLYADLRTVTGIPLVNLIWRHLATLPGMLSWTWDLVRPLHTSGVLRTAAAALLDEVPAWPHRRLPGCVFDAVGVGAPERATITNLIIEYEHGNTTNLLALLAVLAVLRGGTAGGGTPPAIVAPARSGSVTLPPLPRLDALAPPVQALVLALDGFGRTAPSDAVASLYRHLAHWPGFLAVAYAGLAEYHHDGSLRAAHQRTLERGREIMAARLLPIMARPPAADAAGAAATVAALEQFTTQMIARMVVMGRALAALLPADG